MMIQKTIIDTNHTDEPKERKVVSEINTRKLNKGDLVRRGFERGTLTKVTFENKAGYVVVYEKVATDGETSTTDLDRQSG